jgi:chaperonin cofactor prefoldin
MFPDPTKSKSVFEKSAADENWRDRPRRPGLWGAASAALLIAVATAAWYTFPVAKRHHSEPESAGARHLVDTPGVRPDQQNAKLAPSRSAPDEVRTQIADLRREMRSQIEAAKKQAGRSAAELFDRVEVELRDQIDGIKGKVARLEVSRDADRVQIADLQNELSALRNQMAAETEELKDRLAKSGSGTEGKLAALEAFEQRDRQEMEFLNRQLAVRRIDFEVDKGHNYELAPGISLEISGTDVAYRRVTGWMWVLPDHRTIWLRQQDAQQPVVFYSNQDGKKRELVITGVTHKSAVGYLLLPDDSSETASARVPAARTDSNAFE